MAKVVIVGGGVSGLVASHILSKSHDVTVIEAGDVGGEFLKGGLKYIHRTDEMIALFDQLDVPWSEYTIQGGIMLQGEVKPYPRCLSGMPRATSERIQADHFRKTRRTEPARFGAKSMNDPMAARESRRALRCDFQAFVQELAKSARITKRAVTQISTIENRLLLSDGAFVSYDRLILTIPLWVIRQMCDFYCPQGMAMSLNLVQVDPMKDPYAQWDYVYTPYTPAGAVHRFSPRDTGYSVEANGDWDKIEKSVKDDLGFLFPGGYAINKLDLGLKGHLIELSDPPKWPENVVPLGRFAKWDPRATTDTTLEDVKVLAEAWK